MEYRLGIDIGGTSAKLGIVDEKYNVVERSSVVTQNKTADGIIFGIIDAARPLAEKYGVKSVGVGSPGRVVRETGVVERAGHLPFTNEPVAGRISSGLSLPTQIDNDANCALIGEKTAGAAAGYHDAIMITIGTGIGGAVLIHNRVYRGYNNRAGELGHFSMDLNGEVCECGLRGCFELQASATALIKLTKESIESAPQSLLAEIGKKDGIDGRTAFTAARRGCDKAKALLDEYGRRLAMGLDSLTYIFQPQMIVLSGGLSREGQYLLNLITPHKITENPISVSTLHGDAGLIGAAMLGTEHAI